MGISERKYREKEQKKRPEKTSDPAFGCVGEGDGCARQGLFEETG